MNLIGKVFGKLTVIKRLPNKPNSKSCVWECLCLCGRTIIYGSYTLNSGGAISCGCHRDLVGQVFNRLTVIKQVPNKCKNKDRWWECLCICGNTKSVTSSNLKSKKIESCGCLYNNRYEKTVQNMVDTGKFKPVISTAKRVWKRYKQDGIAFDDFYKISQENCTYCGIEPSNKFCAAEGKNSKIFKENGLFIYNGLDRVDSNLTHTKENCVACCINCNIIKSNLSVNNFKELVANIHFNICNQDLNKTYPLLDLPKDWVLKSLKRVVSDYIKNDRRRDKNSKMDIPIEIFYSISQNPCFYCQKPPSNIRNISLNNKKCIYRPEADFIYSGLDRIDSSKDHIVGNLVPCCKQCNWAKSNLSIQKFNAHISKIYHHFIAPTLLTDS